MKKLKEFINLVLITIIWLMISLLIIGVVVDTMDWELFKEMDLNIYDDN
tara:strand:+ start:444 stop:590 length:147 start_codon:yes stop_codon:yes gene_type:complete